jgi:hypothetical protein
MTEQRTALQHAAFIGWQVRDIVMSAMGAGSRPQFNQYLVTLGLVEGVTRKRTTGLAPKGAGTANAERVRDAFRKTGTRKA